MLFDLEETKKTSLDQYVWVKDNHIHMSKEDLSEIKESFSRDDIFAFMAKLIKDKQLPFPYFPYNKRQQRKSSLSSDYKTERTLERNGKTKT